MQPPINNPNTNSKNVLRHSSLAIASFVLSIFSLMFEILLGLSNSSGNGTPSPLAGFIFFVCAITSTVLSIVDLTKNNRKKTLAIWALVFNWGLIILSIVFAIAYFAYYKVTMG